jgi:D-aminopeptidase
MRSFLGVVVAVLLVQLSFADEPPRARDLGIPFDGTPGPFNAITDVAGVTVGHHTLIEDLPNGRSARTGVTAILPLGRDSLMHPVFGAWFSLNGCGEMTGTTWLEESGQLEGPVMLTNTHSVGTVHQATIEWRIGQGGPDASGYYWSAPVVAETWDGPLNDVNGFHVTSAHVASALEGAKIGPVAEGNIGAGTGVVCYDFKCGIGTASRVVKVLGETYTLGVLVQANHGARDELRISGVPVGRHVATNQTVETSTTAVGKNSSIIIVVATDAPLLPHQLNRVVKRAALGLARTGAVAHNGSGDIFVAFTTAEKSLGRVDRVMTHKSVPNEVIDPLFTATVQATEEAIVNALIAARDMTGNQGHSAKAIPHDALMEILERYGRSGVEK